MPDVYCKRGRYRGEKASSKASHVAPSQHQPKLYRREHVTIALTIPASPLLLEEAKVRGWRLVYLWHWNNVLPDQIKLQGALINDLPGSKIVRDLQKRGCACVRIGNVPHHGDPTLLPVLPDMRQEGCVAAEHFAERGFRHVAFFGRNPWSDFHALFEGFQQRSEELGMVCHLYRFEKKQRESPETRRKRLRQEFSLWLKELPKPVGLLATSAWHAAVHCVDISLAGLRIPEDVAVLSRGDKPDLCQGCIPTISSLELDEEGWLRRACDWLQLLMDGEPVPSEPIMIPPKGVIERESTDVLATPDRIVAEALRYMWNHLNADLSVEQIADVVGLSACQLQRRFQKALGRSIVQELLRKRLDEAKHLLLSTDLPIADIAPRVGFHSATYMHRTFRRSFGVTPAQYRRNR
jgi:LacI family transcriptional regulator